jgi:hypothetical protein
MYRNYQDFHFDKNKLIKNNNTQYFILGFIILILLIINIAQKSIEGPEYPPQDENGNLYKEGSNEYKRALNNYKMYQYTQLIVSLARPTCSWIPNVLSSDVNSRASINLIIPPGSKYLYIDADGFPDKFKLNNFTIPSYIQSPDANGSLETWGFIVNMVAPPDVKRTPINPDLLLIKINSDWNEYRGSESIRENITAFVLDNTKDETITTSSPSRTIIKEAINIAGSNTVEIKREIYKQYVVGYDKIKLTVQKGNYIGESIFRFKICKRYLQKMR